LVLEAGEKFQNIGKTEQEEIIQQAKTEDFKPLFPE
jgi:hypothetical protein